MPEHSFLITRYKPELNARYPKQLKAPKFGPVFNSSSSQSLSPRNIFVRVPYTRIGEKNQEQNGRWRYDRVTSLFTAFYKYKLFRNEDNILEFVILLSEISKAFKKSYLSPQIYQTDG